jgi:hypothetical protein
MIRGEIDEVLSRPCYGRYQYAPRAPAALSGGDCVMAGSPENVASMRYRAGWNEAKVAAGKFAQDFAPANVQWAMLLAGGFMHAHKFAALLVVGLAAAGLTAAALAVATAPAGAQSAAPSDHRPATAKRKPAAPPAQVAVASRPPARVTVRRRSYLDPGTETRTQAEHYQDYAFPPGDRTFTADPHNPAMNWTRMPFPSCFDLAGFCQP